MTKDAQVSPGGLRQVASEWFAVMRGPNANMHRAEFEAWLAQDPGHRAAYNRIAEVFSLGKGLKPREPERPAPRRAHLIRQIAQVVLAAALAAAVTGLVVKYRLTEDFLARDGLATSEPVRDSYDSRPGEIRTFSLSDGSLITLDRDSRISVGFTHQRRDIELVKGRARFSVAHERRPFAVKAGNGTVIARGTLFDVALRPGTQAVVTLIEGLVDVEMPGAAPASGSTTVRRLAAGRELRIGKGRASETGLAAGTINWTDQLRDFDDVTLQQLIDDANRHGTIPIRLASADLGRLRVSGTFRVRDTRKLASNLGGILGLYAAQTADGLVLSRECEERSEKNCEPPS